MYKLDLEHIVPICLFTPVEAGLSEAEVSRLSSRWRRVLAVAGRVASVAQWTARW